MKQPLLAIHQPSINIQPSRNLFQKMMFLKIIGKKLQLDIVINTSYATIYWDSISIGVIYQDSRPFELKYQINIFNQKYTQSLAMRDLVTFSSSEVDRIIESRIQTFFKNKFGITATFHEHWWDKLIPKL